ncbi:GtrA family protein [Domibacillus epiphyticus]|uniref:Polysaccharide biosynthesis protein GtrA n=1 Tax=Domibacillus epiphyticus TaxID=1714355 RepID=A0A1V2AAA1_9BACI|nr:GtrA family protein [Domibacillus epiphyticus]OMP67870.1 polysaccharide biosynthesis protein GtrA [Domibacillus epiphyticus]
MGRTGQEFIRFVIIGGINTVTYYVLYLLLHSSLEMEYMFSHIVAFFISMVISFFLNSYITFKVKPTLVKFLTFPLTQLFNFAVSSFFMFVLIEYFHVSSTITPIFAVIIAVPMTFLVTGKVLKKESVAG